MSRTDLWTRAADAMREGGTMAERLTEAERETLDLASYSGTSSIRIRAAVESILAARLAEKDAEIERLRESGLKAVELAAYGRDCNRVLAAERDAALAAVAGIEEAARRVLGEHHHWSHALGACVNQQGAMCGWVGDRSAHRAHIAERIASETGRNINKTGEDK